MDDFKQLLIPPALSVVVVLFFWLWSRIPAGRVRRLVKWASGIGALLAFCVFAGWLVVGKICGVQFVNAKVAIASLAWSLIFYLIHLAMLSRK